MQKQHRKQIISNNNQDPDENKQKGQAQTADGPLEETHLEASDSYLDTFNLNTRLPFYFYNAPHLSISTKIITDKLKGYSRWVLRFSKKLHVESYWADTAISKGNYSAILVPADLEKPELKAYKKLMDADSISSSAAKEIIEVYSQQLQAIIVDLRQCYLALQNLTPSKEFTRQILQNYKKGLWLIHSLLQILEADDLICDHPEILVQVMSLQELFVADIHKEHISATYIILYHYDRARKYRYMGERYLAATTAQEAYRQLLAQANPDLSAGISIVHEVLRSISEGVEPGQRTELLKSFLRLQPSFMALLKFYGLLNWQLISALSKKLLAVDFISLLEDMQLEPVTTSQVEDHTHLIVEIQRFFGLIAESIVINMQNADAPGKSNYREELQFVTFFLPTMSLQATAIFEYYKSIENHLKGEDVYAKSVAAGKRKLQKQVKMMQANSLQLLETCFQYARDCYDLSLAKISLWFYLRLEPRLIITHRWSKSFMVKVVHHEPKKSLFARVAVCFMAAREFIEDFQALPGIPRKFEKNEYIHGQRVYERISSLLTELDHDTENAGADQQNSNTLVREMKAALSSLLAEFEYEIGKLRISIIADYSATPKGTIKLQLTELQQQLASTEATPEISLNHSGLDRAQIAEEMQIQARTWANTINLWGEDNPISQDELAELFSVRAHEKQDYVCEMIELLHLPQDANELIRQADLNAANHKRLKSGKVITANTSSVNPHLPISLLDGALQQGLSSNEEKPEKNTSSKAEPSLETSHTITHQKHLAVSLLPHPAPRYFQNKPSASQGFFGTHTAKKNMNLQKKQASSGVPDQISSDISTKTISQG